MIINKLYFKSILFNGFITKHSRNLFNNFQRPQTLGLVHYKDLSFLSSPLLSRNNLLHNISSRTYSSATKKTYAVNVSKPVKRTEPVELTQGKFKTYTPRTPGLRWLKRPVNDHLWKGKPIRKLTEPKRKKSGRNHHGCITVRHQGGGHKRRIRIIDFYRWDPEPHEVIRIEYDPNRSAHLALLQNTVDKKYSYIIAPYNLQPGSIIRSFRNSSESKILNGGNSQDSEITKVIAIEKGNCMPLKLIPVGTTINCISLKPDGPAILCRSAGVSAQLIRTGEKGYAQVKLKSGEVRLIHVDCCATIGTISNPDHQHATLGKAGRSRWLGIRPTVRGVAMNSVDHPHGGGRGKSKGNKDPVSPWGVLAKGGKTRRKPNKWVVKPRQRR
ncbi:translation protein SH3-like domain-containing protein [Glomus cerebriforme]|uniref:Large ribosomal subunit protein uL2m n=1 Tax=Glomus cerebriforme TaxID=658196 RepID=A0A397TLM2_9GLOM|nr:translation protein SH3-like domain-containing protein [Glomus cerebriforme]